MTIHRSDFPTLDADRSHPDREYSRTVIDVFRPVEPYITEMDSWVAMPLRLAHSQANGFYLEVGPYDMDAADIAVLRKAVAAYDAATIARPAEATE